MFFQRLICGSLLLAFAALISFPSTGRLAGTAVNDFVATDSLAIRAIVGNLLQHDSVSWVTVQEPSPLQEFDADGDGRLSKGEMAIAEQVNRKHRQAVNKYVSYLEKLCFWSDTPQEALTDLPPSRLASR